MAVHTLLRYSVYSLLFLLWISESSEQKQYLRTNGAYWTFFEEKSAAIKEFGNTDDLMDGSGGNTTDDTTTENYNVTTASQVCASGYFGLDCAFRCYCKDPSDICDPVYGHCSSGCHQGWYGPGCIAEVRQGSIAIVVVLSILLVISLILCLILCAYIIHDFIEDEKKKFRRLPDSPVGGGISYHGQDITAGSQRFSGQMSNEIKTTIPRIKETDIQVMNDVIGKGKFGNVNRGFIKKGNKNVEVAFKTLQGNMSEEDKSNFSSHLELYSSIGQHENVINFYGVCAVGGQIYAAFEYAIYGNLKNFLRRNSVPESQRDNSSTRMSKTTPMQIALDVANGMLYLSNKQIVHGKLCAKHILLGSKYTAKISGLKPRGGMSQIVRWTAPEAIHEMKYTSQCDVWSFGILLWEIVTYGSKPYSDVSTGDLYSLLNSGYRMPQPDGVDNRTYGLIRSCWRGNPEERPSFNALSAKLREMVVSIEFQESMDNIDDIDDIDLGIDEDLDMDSGSRFGRIAFDNSAFDIEA